MKELIANIKPHLQESLKGLDILLSKYGTLAVDLKVNAEELSKVLGELEKAKAELKEIENKKTHQELKNKLEKEIKRYEDLTVSIMRDHTKAKNDTEKTEILLKDTEAKNISAGEVEQSAIRKSSDLLVRERKIEGDKKKLKEERGELKDKEMDYLIRLDALSTDEDKIKEDNKDIARRRANLNATAENLKILEKELREKYGKK